VEITDIAKVILQRGFVNSIDFIPFDEDPRDILGMLVKWENRFLYGSVTEHCAVCYNSNVADWLQRLSCGKEMVHILDGGSARTNTPESVNALLDSLFPSGGERIVLDIFRRQERHEHFALYQATSLMFPRSHRSHYSAKLTDGQMTIDDVAAEYDMPVDAVGSILSQQWFSAEDTTLPMF